MKLLLESENVSKAFKLATDAHKGQVDKAGVDYILHPIAVAESLSTEDEQTAALLHDTIEDTYITLDDLRAAGFSETILCAVDCLTHRAHESRENYLQRIAKNPLATTVKLADLAHNANIGRLPSPTEKDYARIERYNKEMNFLCTQRKDTHSSCGK